MGYREVAQVAAGGRFAPNVKGEVRRVSISHSLFTLQTLFTHSLLSPAVLLLLFLRGFA
jgi:hypothetical protein